MAAKFPTGALAAFSSPAAKWGAIADEGCQLLRFVTPTELGGED